MVKIKFIRDSKWWLNSKVEKFSRDQVIEIDDKTGAEMIEAKYAVLVVDTVQKEDPVVMKEEKKKEEAAPENKSMDVPENKSGSKKAKKDKKKKG